MSFRAVAATLVFTTLSGCAAPRAGIVIGAATTLAGGVLIASSGDCSPHCDLDDLNGYIGKGILGTAIIGVGLGILASGLVGLSVPPSAPPATARIEGLEPTPATRVIEAPGPTAARPDSAEPAAAALAERTTRLAGELRIAARAGHCEAATLIARRLAVLDRATLIAMIDRDQDVARCVAYRM